MARLRWSTDRRGSRRAATDQSADILVRSFEDRVAAESSVPRRIELLHRTVVQLAEHDRDVSHRANWTTERHERWVAKPVRHARSASTLPDPIEGLLDRVLSTSSGLIGSNLPRIDDRLPLVDVDDLARRWLDVVTEEDRPTWIATPASAHTSQRRDVGLSLAATKIVARYIRLLDIDRSFVPALVVCAALRRARMAAPRPTLERLVGELNPLVAHGSLLFECDTWLSTRTRPRHIGVVAPFPLTDTGHGAPAPINGTVSALALHNEVEVVCTVGPHRDRSLATQRTGVVEIPRPEQRKSWRRVRLVVGMLRGRPPWALEWDSPDFTTAVSTLAERSDITHVEFLLLADVVPRDAGSVVVIDHDPPVASSALQLTHDPWWLRPFRLLEIQAWARTHRRAGKRSTLMVVFAPDDKRIVGRLVKTTPVVVAPLGIVLPAKPLDPAGTASATITSVGSYRRRPNIDAVKRLVDNIMPLVWQRRPDAQLLVVGPEPPACVTNADRRIVATGFIDDVSTVVDAAAVFAAPIHLGHGMRVKIVEALAWGKAVVTTTKGAAGLPDAARQCMVVVDDDDAFADAVVDLLGDPARRTHLGKASRAWAEDWLHEERSAERLENLHVLVDALSEAAQT